MIYEKKNLKTHIKDYIIITIASFFYGLAISQFLDPNDIAPGGVSGLSMIINRIIDIEVGTIILMINIPILLLGLYKFGIKFLISTIYATVMGSIFTNILAAYPPITSDPLLATIGGSSIASIAIGYIFKAGATTGGTDIIVKVLRLKFPHLKTGRLFLICDLDIIYSSAYKIVIFKLNHLNNLFSFFLLTLPLYAYTLSKNYSPCKKLKYFAKATGSEFF